jgi:hypothetical protein
MAKPFEDLLELMDFNGLLRAVDGLCAQRDWEGLLDLANRCEEAIERGKQLWPIAAHIDYRLALEAPGEYAAEALTPETDRFAHGPLTEVAASTHAFEELAPYVEFPQVAAYLAQERVLRGEDLTGDERAHPEVLELPLRLEDFEPAYPLATFNATYVEVAEPWDLQGQPQIRFPKPAAAVPDDEAEDALLSLVTPWTAESNGAARAVVVDGDALGAASHLTYGTLRVWTLTPDLALQKMAWAAASGGAHGRRRGAAFGRFLAWHTASLLAGLEWPPAAAELGRALRELRWFWWDEGEPEEGWVLRLAVEDPQAGWAAAVAATDIKEEAPAPGG